MQPPWAGKIGIAPCCLYCGEFGFSYTLMSNGTHCQDCDPKTQEPIPQLWEKYKKEMDFRAKLWCEMNGYDYARIMELWMEDKSGSNRSS